MGSGSTVFRLPIVDQYLREQGDLTAVERFSKHHDAPGGSSDERIYSELIPLTKPQEGEQYGFQVDLDRCTGCKACVSACHSMNGLDQDETWRFVGLLHGGTAEAPVQQTVTTACHHCVDPACLKGCPVDAYDKDPVTGIVKHLDDQCIGCQYCTLTCPYEVPQYNAKKGIVRKCDMCSDRLAEGLAPACVQACPNEAISIRIVSQEAMVEEAQSDTFLPGAPSPGITVPTTTWKRERALPRNTLPADFYSVHPSHQHRPLVVMLVLTQLSTGAFCFDRAVQALFGGPALAALLPVHSLTALFLGLLALASSTFHLGRPLYAFRAVLGLKTSWLSREIVVFGGFAGSAVLYAAVIWRERLCEVLGCPPLPETLVEPLVRALGFGVAFFGVFGVFCSVMLYHVTLRRFWNFARTAGSFYGTTFVLGAATTLFCAVLAGVLAGGARDPASLSQVARALAQALTFGTLVKLVHEATIFLHLGDRQQGDLKRSALLMIGDLRGIMQLRFAAAMLGGVIFPLVLRSLLTTGFSAGALVCASLCLLCSIAGELLERSVFFAAMSSPRMPGGLS